MITFSDFVQKLYSICGNGDTIPNFLLTVLYNFTEKQSDSVFDKDDSELRKIFNGKRNFPKKSASYILSNIDKAKFDTYLYDLLSEDARFELCNIFAPFISNATTENITTELSCLFTSIFMNITDKTLSVKKTSVSSFSFFDIDRELTEIAKSILLLRNKILKMTR